MGAVTVIVLHGGAKQIPIHNVVETGIYIGRRKFGSLGGRKPDGRNFFCIRDVTPHNIVTIL